MVRGRKATEGLSAGRVRALLSGLALASVVTLVLLHLAVLWDRVAQGRLNDPEIALRWMGAVVLTLALLGLRRLGVPLLWGRRALVFWLLVLLLHVGVAVPEDAGPSAAPVRLLFVLPASVAPAGLLLAFLLALIVRGGLLAPALAWRRAAACVVSPRRGGVLLALAPRAPPA